MKLEDVVKKSEFLTEAEKAVLLNKSSLFSKISPSKSLFRMLVDNPNAFDEKLDILESFKGMLCSLPSSAIAFLGEIAKALPKKSGKVIYWPVRIITVYLCMSLSKGEAPMARQLSFNFNSNYDTFLKMAYATPKYSRRYMSLFSRFTYIDYVNEKFLRRGASA